MMGVACEQAKTGASPGRTGCQDAGFRRGSRRGALAARQFQYRDRADARVLAAYSPKPGMRRTCSRRRGPARRRSVR